MVILELTLVTILHSECWTEKPTGHGRAWVVLDGVEPLARFVDVQSAVAWAFAKGYGVELEPQTDDRVRFEVERYHEALHDPTHWLRFWANMGVEGVAA